MSDSTTVANINTVAGMTSGVLTATVTSGAASVLKALTTTSTDAITMTVNAEAASAATQAADLVSLNGNTNQAIIMTAVSSVSGNYADLLDIYVTNKTQYTGIGDETVTITGSVSATQADTIADATSGSVSATINSDTAANLNAALNDSGSQVNAYTLTVSDSGTTLASDLTSLDSKTSVTVNATAVTSIGGTANEIAIAVAATGINTSSTYNVSVTGGTVATVADLITINNDTSGTITLNAATNSANYSDTTANILAAFNGITSLTGTMGLSDSTTVANINTVAGMTSGVLTATVSETAIGTLVGLSTLNTDMITTTVSTASVAATDLTTLYGKTGVAVNASSVTTISGTAASVQTVYSAGPTEITGLGNESISITDTGTLASSVITTLDAANGTGVVTLSGTGSLSLTTTAGQNLDLSGVTNSLTGTLSISDNTGNENITGTAGNDTLNLSSGNDVINLGAGNDTINIATMNDLTSSDVITDTSGTDTLNINGAGSIASTAFNVTGFENLNLSTSNDTVTFTDKGSFDTWIGKFSSIDGNSGTSDTLSFGSAVTADLDFTKLHNFETLTFSDNADIVTFGSDEYTAGIRTLNLGNTAANTANLNANTTSQVAVNGGYSSDTFNLDFSRLSENDYSINGGAGSDTVVFTLGSTTGTSISLDTNFNSFGTSLTNIESMDLRNLSLNTDSTGIEFNFTDTMIKQWTGNATGTLSLSLTSAQTDLIKFTDNSGDSLTEVHDTQLSAGTYNYTLKDDGVDGSTHLQLIVSA